MSAFARKPAFAIHPLLPFPPFPPLLPPSSSLSAVWPLTVF